MSGLRITFLVTLVVISAGLTVWLVVAAAETHHLDMATLGAALPLLMLGGIAVRALTRGRESGK